MPGAAPVAITAHLAYRREQSDRLAATTGDARTLLREFHDELMSTLAPRLAGLQSDGLIVSQASSWRLGEVVVHSLPATAAETERRLREFPELKDVGAAAPLHGRGKRRR